MKECWALDPEVRPTFDNLYTMLDKVLRSTAGYLELGMLLLPDENEVMVENRYSFSSHDCVVKVMLL